MGRIGVILVMFVLAVGVSLGISFLLWGRPTGIGEISRHDTEIDELRARLAAAEAQLRADSGNQSGSPISYEDFEALLSRLDAMNHKVEKLSAGKPAGSTLSKLGTQESLSTATEETVRQVLQDVEEEKRREEEEERQRRREERWRETQEWLTNVYNERLILLTKELSLTPNQEAAVREALNARRESVLKVYGQWRLPESERREGDAPSWDKINEDFGASMKRILDPQQFQTYKRKNLDDFNRGRGRGRGGRGR